MARRSASEMLIDRYCGGDPNHPDLVDAREEARLERQEWCECAISLLEEINADAEADMLRGNPITGAHYRAIMRKLEALRETLAEFGPGEW